MVPVVATGSRTLGVRGRRPQQSVQSALSEGQLGSGDPAKTLPDIQTNIHSKKTTEVDNQVDKY